MLTVENNYASGGTFWPQPIEYNEDDLYDMEREYKQEEKENEQEVTNKTIDY